MKVKNKIHMHLVSLADQIPLSYTNETKDSWRRKRRNQNKRKQDQSRIYYL